MDVTTSLDDGCNCSGVSELLSQVGNRWTVQVVVALRANPRRFNDIKRQVDGISQQMLTRTLKALERDGMVMRTVHATKPPQVEYALTELGKSLAVPLRELAQWARAHRAVIHESRLRYESDL